jgi:hypothetical protein
LEFPVIVREVAHNATRTILRDVRISPHPSLSQNGTTRPRGSQNPRTRMLGGTNAPTLSRATFECRNVAVLIGLHYWREFLRGAPEKCPPLALTLRQ